MAAGVAAQNATTLTWTPTSNAVRYLTSQLPTVPATGAFGGDWNVLPPQADWEYTATGATVNIAATVQASTAGFKAINNQMLPGGAVALHLTANPQPHLRPSVVSLIFNYISANDFWALGFNCYDMVAETEFLGVQTNLILTHYLNGQAITAGQGTSSVIENTQFISLDLNVDGSHTPLAFTAALTTRNATGGVSIFRYGITFPPPPATTAPTGPTLLPPFTGILTEPVHLAVNPVMVKPVVPAAGTTKVPFGNRLRTTEAAAAPAASDLAVFKDLPALNLGSLQTLPPVVTGNPDLQQFVAGSFVGIATDYVGSTDFSLLQVTYASNPTPQVLLPAPGLGRLLGRLTVKRDLLKPADVQGNLATSARPDFSRWFWVLPAPAGVAHYGSGSGSAAPRSGSAAGSGDGTGIGGGSIVFHPR